MSNRRFVLIIALSDYRDAAMPCLPGVQRDAERLRATFENYADGGVYRFYWLLNGKASKQAIIDKLRETAEQAGATDQVIVYFGGHGYREWSSASKSWRYYLLPYDASFATAATQAISTDELGALLNTLHAREVVVILDCCHSGGMTKFEWTNELLDELLEGWRSQYLLAASRGREQVGEDDWGGFFMQAFCDALQGEGVTSDAEGRVSAQKAWSHAADVANRAAARRGHQQVAVSAGISSPIYLTRPKRSRHGHDQPGPMTSFPVPHDEQVQKVKGHAEFETVTVFQHQILTSLHLLFSLCEADVAYPSRRNLRQLVNVEALCKYIQDRSAYAGDGPATSIQTTSDYEATFERARQMADIEGSSAVTVTHLLGALAALRPRSVTRYLKSRQLNWEQFAQVFQTLQRGRLASPE